MKDSDLDAARLVRILRMHLNMNISPIMADLLLAEAKIYCPKSNMPAWMVVYLRMSRAKNRRLDPVHALWVTTLWKRQPKEYQPLSNRLVTLPLMLQSR